MVEGEKDMKQIVVISGKGGTGKTMLAASIATIAKNKVVADCDVDAADLHLLMHPSVIETHEFRSGTTAVIDVNMCEKCGECRSVCRFDAIREDFKVDPLSCEGCGVCGYLCPSEAISMIENIAGEWYVSDTRYGPMVHATLGVAEENSGKLVSMVKQAAERIGDDESMDYLIIDGPPGIGCPVISSITNADLALIVTEPTLSGIHDMERVIGVSRHFGIPTKVVINKYNLNLTNTKKIVDMSNKQKLDIVGYIPYSRSIIESIVNRIPYTAQYKDRVTDEIFHIWENIK
jgi:MinD superfamily P-loop ATPase